MSNFHPRAIDKFENLTGSVTQTIPIAEYNYDFSQDFRLSMASVVGADYGLDLTGTGPALKDFAHERISVTIVEGSPGAVDTTFEAIKFKLHSIGVGKLWSIDSASVKWWAYARAAGMPTMRWQAGDIFRRAIALHFIRMSDWFVETATTVSQNVTTNGQEWTVANPGLPTDQMTILLTPLASAGIREPKITNLTTGAEMEINRISAATTERLRLNTTLIGGPRLEYSTNSGTTWVNGAGYYEMPPITQAALTFSLAAGNNTFKLVGTTPNVNIQVSFHARVG